MLVLTLAGAVFVATLHRRGGTVAILVVCALDVVSFAYVAPWHGQSLSPAAAHTFYDSSPPVFGAPYAAPGGIDRWASDWYGFRSISLAKDLLGVNGYDPLIQKDWAATAGAWQYDGYPTRPDLWSPGWTSDVLRISTLVLSNSVTPTDASWRRDGPVPGIAFTRWVRTPRLPDAYLVGAVDLAPLGDIQSQLRNPYAALSGNAFVEQRTTAMSDLDRPGRAGRVVTDDLLRSQRLVVDAAPRRVPRALGGLGGRVARDGRRQTGAGGAHRRPGARRGRAARASRGGAALHATRSALGPPGLAARPARTPLRRTAAGDRPARHTAPTRTPTRTGVSSPRIRRRSDAGSEGFGG